MDGTGGATFTREQLREKRDEELNSAFLYAVVARAEPPGRTRRLFEELERAASAQAAIWAGLGERHGALEPFQPSLRARIVAGLVRRFGARRLKPVLASVKVRGLSVFSAPLTQDAAAADHEAGRHRAAAQGANLRAAVFGVSDGLVSNASLILGVGGASVEPGAWIATGFAGLLAGALSMAAGEYVSVRSQRELFEHQIALERDELSTYAEEEEAEIALILVARGLAEDEARAAAKKMMADPEQALDTLAREELGLDPTSLGSPWGAALSSFVAFALGAAIPLLPLFFLESTRALVAVAITAIVALFAVGALLSLFTGRHPLWSGLRLAGIGGAAAAATFGIGRLFGVALD